MSFAKVGSVGYFRFAYEFSKDPVDGELNYIWLGFMILASPILLPLFYVGRFGAWVLSDE